MKPSLIVLLAEDDEDDLFFSKRVLQKAGLVQVYHVKDGQEAMDYLAGKGAYEERQCHPLPGVVLLDLKMPLFTGHQVLEWIRAQREFDDLKVYILTSSDEPRDRSRAEAAGACGYLVKPLAPAHLREIFPDSVSSATLV
jgi:CheY-like chemotaxis protein